MRNFFSRTIKKAKTKYVHGHSRPLMRQWIISYISVLLLPILIFSHYYIHTYNVVKEVSGTNQKLILENAMEQLNYIFYDSMTLSNTLVLNKYVQPLSYENAKSINSPDLERYLLSRELNALKASNRLLEDIILYFPSSDYLVSSNSAYEASLLPKMTKTPIFLEDLSFLCESLKENNLLCLTSGTNSSFLLAQPLAVNSEKEILSLALIQINKKELTNRLQTTIFSNNESGFSLINEYGVLFSFGKDLALDDDSAVEIWQHCLDNSQSSTHDFTLNDQKYILQCKSSKIQSIKLISLTDERFYNIITNHQLLEKMLSLLVFCLLLGLSVTFYYSKKNYRPVSQIMNYIDRDVNDPEMHNEYQLIIKFLKKNQSELEQQRALLQNNYLKKLLMGEVTVSPTTSPVALSFTSTHSCVIGIQIQPESIADQTSDNTQLLHFIIQNILSELLTPIFPDHNYCIISQHEIFVLVQMPSADANEQDLENIRTVVQRLYEFLAGNYQIEFLAGISNINSNETIPDSYVQVNSILEYLRLFSQKSIKLYSELPSNPVITSIHLNTRDYVQNLLISGSNEQLDDYFSLIQSEISQKNLSTSDAKSCYYFFYLATMQISRYCQTHYAFTPSSLEFINEKTYFSFPLQQSLNRIHSSYRSFIKELSDFRNASESNGWGYNICQYIENNYFDLNLNLNNVAEHFSLTPAYLSKKFKEKYGKSINDYLYEIRITHAKQLIKETNLNMSEIAQITGFIDSSAFIRVFKKYVGITPGKYKTADL